MPSRLVEPSAPRQAQPPVIRNRLYSACTTGVFLNTGLNSLRYWLRLCNRPVGCRTHVVAVEDHESGRPVETDVLLIYDSGAENSLLLA